MAKPAREYLGGLIHYIDVAFTFADSATQVEIGTVPSGATILKPLSGIQVNTAFNAGTTNTVDVGTSATEDLYGTALAGGTVTFVPLDEAVSLTMAADTTLYVKYEQTGTAATAGAGKAIIAYIIAT